ncbi:MerR family transcriptional regulator [Aminobacter sp. DSM 101952]|uniref:MerR family transcriptional regulator n=1 Tax=Aminobacter sp. DSM 101952 TaxID=2735891 RepID=UPI0006F661B3|nr:MerR family transcriptional regulator [Aminobacter sp. DSM 101952]KQU74742.1 MerR family transcriptional regulator [Aminobacter sp. DSM 101952]
MDDRIYTIGELSKLSGITVRKLRFYSDRGLLPPTIRAESGYRMYSGADLERLGLILALRDAGVSLAEIGKILSNRLAISAVLELRLKALEAEIKSKRRVAAALRAAIRVPDPTTDDLRRIWTVTKLSQTEFRAAIEGFFDAAAADANVSPEWRKQMIDSSTPELPDDPTPEQVDAWTEIMAFVSDKEYVAELRKGMATMWNGEFDPAAYAEASNATFARVREAIGKGKKPDSDTGKAIARDWLESSAKAMNRTPDKAFLEWHDNQYRKYHGRSARYYELLRILRGDRQPDTISEEWSWINAAMGAAF